MAARQSPIDKEHQLDGLSKSQEKVLVLVLVVQEVVQDNSDAKQLQIPARSSPAPPPPPIHSVRHHIHSSVYGVRSTQLIAWLVVSDISCRHHVAARIPLAIAHSVAPISAQTTQQHLIYSPSSDTANPSNAQLWQAMAQPKRKHRDTTSETYAASSICERHKTTYGWRMHTPYPC